MRKRALIDSLSVRLTPAQRLTIERLSETEGKGLGEVARDLLHAGMEARGLKV